LVIYQEPGHVDRQNKNYPAYFCNGTHLHYFCKTDYFNLASSYLERRIVLI
jgi:hypothetical protein